LTFPKVLAQQLTELLNHRPLNHFRLTLSDMLRRLQPAAGTTFATGFTNGTMSIELYQPHLNDHQQPHRQDEVYVIVSGRGIFNRDGERVPFAPHDVLFVPAGMAHRFEEFSEDFVTWVIFYGPYREQGTVNNEQGTVNSETPFGDQT
jgi:mannose-6-phosphate isomerase-like protein (cupin superfamily)